MSQLTAHDAGGAHAQEPPHVAARRLVDEDAVSPPAWSMLSKALIFVGIVALVVTGVVAVGAGDEGRQQVLSAYMAGVVYAVTLAVGSMGFVMILQQFNAGWSAVIRRQLENVACLVVVPAILFVPILFVAPDIWKWMTVTAADHDVLLEHKSGYLNRMFWSGRAIFYFAIWIVLAWQLFKFSRAQDESGDVWLTAKARKMSSFGILIFALTSAFASFDWLMGLDHHWFSTMFGVYFFAGSVLSTVALCVLVLGLLKSAGKLEGIVTVEHFHDLGKLMCAFTVFWAYISFSQYFLIWYSQIPEETWWYMIRTDGDRASGWKSVFLLLCFGHFLAPFILLLFRPLKRNMKAMMALAVWILVIHVVDLFFIVMPEVKSKTDNAFGHLHIDIVAIAGPVLLFLGLVFWRMTKSPLIPIKDPRLHESLEHKNYV